VGLSGESREYLQELDERQQYNSKAIIDAPLLAMTNPVPASQKALVDTLDDIVLAAHTELTTRIRGGFSSKE
jgi:hypothetical protein